MGLHNIEQPSKGYELLKIWIRFWHNHVFYRSFVINGLEKVPKNKPMIVTPNHSNALMDALAVLFSINKLFVFLARADIFKNPKIASILYFLKILPIYRVRDGFDTVKKSRDILRKASDIITSGDAMVILPEGNHSRIRRLRQLKKGFARMAFQTEELNDYKLDLQIVPVGIDYDDFMGYRSSVVMTFGEPVPVLDYVEEYKTNQPVALNQIKEHLSRNLAPLIINIRSEEYYDFYNDIRFIVRDKVGFSMGTDPKLESNRVIIDQHTIKFIERLESDRPERFMELYNTYREFTMLVDKLGLNYALFTRYRKSMICSIMQALSLIVLFPVFIYGTINNMLPYFIPIMTTRKFKDEQFISSVKFVVSAVLFPIFYIVQTLIVLGFTNYKIALLYLLSLPLSAILAWKWSRIYKQLSILSRYILKKLSKNQDQQKAFTLFNSLITIVKNEVILQ